MFELKISPNKPQIHPKIAVEGFAGGGGVAIAMHEMGYCPKVAIEKHPVEKKQPLYDKIADCYDLNFGQDTKLYRMSIEDWAMNEFPGCPREKDIELAHFSPSCCNFSNQGCKDEHHTDIDAAIMIAKFIKEFKPKRLTIENVNSYKDSVSFSLIEEVLQELNYYWASGLVDFNELGVPQTRERFITVAALDCDVRLPQKHNSLTWFDVIGDMIEKLPELELLEAQKQAIANYKGFSDEIAYIIPRIGYYGKTPRLCPQDKPAPTIVASIFTDQKNNNRNRFWNIVYKGKSYQVTLECIRKLCTFPNWYKLPESIAIAGTILGNAIPPLAYMHILNDCFLEF